MRPVTTTNTTTTTVNGSIHQWNSPIPYLFSGLAVMLGLIAFALVILACSYKKSSSSSSSSSSSNSLTHAVEKPVSPLPEMEPKIVVIMAGDENPTYLAKPVSSSQAQHTEQV